MSFTMEFDNKNAILRITFEGRVEDRDAFLCSEAARKWLAVNHPSSSIVDLSRVTRYDVSANAIKELSALPRTDFHGMLVIVAPKDAAFGMSRMFQILTERKLLIRVVRTVDEAFTVLDVVSPEFSPLASAKTA